MFILFILSIFILANSIIPTNYDDLALINNSQQWSIHGFWPEFNKTTWPQFCNKTRYYDFTRSTLQGNLLNQMNKYWPSNTNLEETDKETNWEFWTHEWRKHGTCQSRDPRDYFQNTINLFLQARQNNWYECCNNQFKFIMSSECLIHINQTTNKWLGYCMGTGEIPR